VRGEGSLTCLKPDLGITPSPSTCDGLD
jgi:hypothetical protein